MPNHLRTVQVTLHLSAASLDAYDQAVLLLRQKLGAQAPNFVALVQHELAHRDSRMIADDYLETRRPDFGPKKLCRLRTKKQNPRRSRRDPPSPSEDDPSRN